MSPLIIFLGALFFGLICLGIGQNRKQSSAINFLAGFLLGPIGLILVLVSPKKETLESENEIKPKKKNEKWYKKNLKGFEGLDRNVTTRDCLIILGMFFLFIIIIAVVSSGGEKEGVGHVQISQLGISKESQKLSIKEIKNRAIENLNYDELLRNNDKYIGEIVYYRGEVNQVVEGWGGNYTLRIFVTKGEYGLWDDDIWANYQGKRVLEEDIVDIWGKVKGVKKYTTVLGDRRSIPEIDVLHLELVKETEEDSSDSIQTPEPKSSFTPSCTNDCSYAGQKRCKENNLQVCGNYDFNECLEWETTQECKYGCSNNKCIVPLGYSRQTPVSVGVPLTLEIEEWEKISKVKVTLLEIVRGAEAWNRIKEANMFNDPPKSGFEYLLAKVKFEYLKGPTQDTTYHLSTWEFTAVSSEGKDYESASVVEPEPELDATLYQGASHTGWVAFQVAKSDFKPLMTFGRKYDGTGGIWFKLY